jgi:hypothetical protein
VVIPLFSLSLSSASEFFDKIGSTVPSELRRRLLEMNAALSDQGAHQSAAR